MLLHTTANAEFVVCFNVQCDSIIVSATSLFNLSALVCIIQTEACVNIASRAMLCE